MASKDIRDEIMVPKDGEDMMERDEVVVSRDCDTTLDNKGAISVNENMIIENYMI